MVINLSVFNSIVLQLKKLRVLLVLILKQHDKITLNIESIDNHIIIPGDHTYESQLVSFKK